jgi:hypothetical protein
MLKKSALSFPALVVCLLAVFVTFVPRAVAQDEDPPSRVARLAFVEGSVSFEPAGTQDWVGAGLNRPLTTGDTIWSDQDGRVELQLDNSFLRLSNNTGFSFLNLTDDTTQIQLTAGTLLVRVRRLGENDTYEVDTPNLAFSILRPGVYRIGVDESGNVTHVKIRNGQAEVTGAGAAYSLKPGDSFDFSGAQQLAAQPADYDSSGDQFDTWADGRDHRWDNSPSARYVNTDVVGYDDLDEHGSWSPAGEYGNVWFPNAPVPGWAPYHYGHWAYIAPWGYTWVDDQPWGFAPFHYGRWVFFENRWGWVPAPPQPVGVAFVRVGYAPALVAWVGGGAVVAGGAVAWFPLGPREVFVPSYPVSRAYVEQVNVSNTVVNTTVINNVYNTTIVNKNVTVTNIKYVNQSVPGAVVATNSQAFTSAQPVTKNAVKVDERAVATAPVRAYTPADVPQKQAVLGSAAAARAKPPAAVAARTVVAKTQPPPPPPTFEKRQEAIKNNGGRPLSVAEVRKIETPAVHPTVKVAPAAKPVAPPQTAANRASQPATKEPAARPAQPAPNRPPEANRPDENRPPASNAKPPENRPAENKPVEKRPPEANRPPAANKPAEPPVNANKPPAKAPEPNRAAPPAAREKETPPPAKPAQPPASSATTERQQQAQEQLRQRQAQEKQKLQQQQAEERDRAAQQHADATKQQQLQRQHEEQTKQLQQKHEAEQKQLQEKQNQEKAKQPKP